LLKGAFVDRTDRQGGSCQLAAKERDRGLVTCYNIDFANIVAYATISISLCHSEGMEMIKPQTESKSTSNDSSLTSFPAPALPTVLYSWKNVVPLIAMHYIRDYDEANLKVSELKPGPFGFDLEWKPSFKKGQPANRVALVQLANNETILLIQVCAMRSKSILLIRPYCCVNLRSRFSGAPQGRA
jgi:hypothetical protein